MAKRIAMVLVAASLLSFACERKGDDPARGVSTGSPASVAASASAIPPAASIDPQQLAAFPPLLAKPDAATLDEAALLGRRLYFDVRVSKAKDVSCNSCHEVARTGADGKALAKGSGGATNRRNTPTIYNAALTSLLGWDARTTTFDDFVTGHLADAAIFGFSDEKGAVDRIAQLPGYTAAFKKAFPDAKPSVSAETVSKALLAFARKLVTPSRWDKFLGGDGGALSDEEKSGVNAFIAAGCTTCHAGKFLGATQAQKLGLAKRWPDPAGSDPGKFDVSKQEIDRGVWKAPSLRNVALTAPYLHDGSVPSLEEATRLMSRHQLGKELTESQVKAIVAFMKTLSGEAPKELVSQPE